MLWLNRVIEWLGDVWYFLLGMEMPSEKQKRNNWDVPKVIVLIPAFNEGLVISRTVTSALNQEGVDVRVLVVDDCSTDDTAKVALQAGAEVISLEQNSGTKAGAQNSVLRFIPEDCLVVTIDADTTLDPDSIKKLVAPLVNENVASTCGFVIPQRRTTVWELARYAQYLFGLHIGKGGQNNLGSPLVSSGCFSAYRASLLKKYGGFPTRTMVEDMDLTWTQLEDGYKVVFVPEAVCYPMEPADRVTYMSQLDRWYRGFFQVIALHKYSLWKNLAMLFFVLWGLLEGLLAPLIVFTSANTLFHFMYGQENSITTLSLVVVVGFVLVFASVLWGSWKRGELWIGIKSIPCYLIVYWVDLYVFFRSFVLEWILRRRLTVWIKGH